MKKQSTLLLLLVGLLANVAFGQQNSSIAVHFTWGAESFPANYDASRQKPTVLPSELVGGYYIRYIQCSTVPTQAERAALEAAGLEFYGYVHFGAFLVGIPQNFDLNKLAALRVRSMIPVKNEWKLARTLRERPFGDWAVHGNEVDINIQVYPSMGIVRGTERCRQQGLTVLKQGTQNGFIQLRIPQADLEAVAALPFVRHLELVPPPSQPEDINGRSIHRANLLDSDSPLGKKFDGTGVNILVRDDGQLGPHIDLQGRLDNSFAEGEQELGTHGDGVGGIMGGAGNLDPTKKGMASGSKVYAVDYESDFQDETLPLHIDQKVTITNTSYSNGCNAGYTLASQTVDQQIYENPALMHVFSAGNSNGLDCGYGAGNQWGNITGGHKMGKNSIATANLSANLTLEGSSSRGPAHDGRLKPDISAHGAGQNSLDPNNGYQEFGGTSAAAPGIAGCLTQLTHAYKSLHNDEQPPSALLKAMLLNTANDLGNVGPDFRFGWGHVNIWRAFRTLELNRWKTGTVEQGADVTETIQIPSQTRLARVMIVWADPPAQEEASRALINDLDLTVAASSGPDYLPWRLDPTPDADILNAPAGKGRDSLNNVEQVAIENPVAGTYTVHIKGTEVPFGPQRYYLVWEFLNDELKITYPNGGEGLVPGEVTRIYWDAYGTTAQFTLRYSLDDGANFQPITTTTGEKRYFDWTMPNTVSGQVRFLLLRNPRRDTSDFASSISAVPQDLQVTRVCPDSMTISWSQVNDTLTYDAYLLGKKYMEWVATSKAGALASTFAVSNPFKENWVSVRTSHPNGLTGRRALAISWSNGLKNCPQEYDVRVNALLSPGNAPIVACSNTERPVQVQIINEGFKPLTGLVMNYQVGTGPVVSETVPDIAPAASLDFTFQTPLAINTNGAIHLKIWSTYNNDKVPFNDTLAYNIQVATSAQTGYFNEGFETPLPLPDGWGVDNPDGDVTWTKFRALTQPIGPDGLPTEAVFMNFYDYDSLGREDFLYMIPVDLSTTPNPGLTFDLAHTEFDENYSDSLRVELFTDCDLTAAPEVIWGKSDPLLATAAASQNQFLPNNAGQWRNELVDLSKYAGKKVIIRFVSVNGYGNNLYLDNIGIIKYEVSLPDATFTASTDSICRIDTMQFAATNPKTGVQYTWNFGSNAQPSIASGPGPHEVRYIINGLKNIRLIASNVLGADTATTQIAVIGNPAANFTAAAPSGLSVTFNNTSTNAATYFWEFGDGQTSTEKSPTHTYSVAGAYLVKLTLTNFCNTATKSLTVTLTSGVHDLEDQVRVHILPNPTAGDFVVEMTSRVSGAAQITLLDAQGRLIKNTQIDLRPGLALRAPFEHLQLSAGVYQLNVQTDEGMQTFSVVVQ